MIPDGSGCAAVAANPLPPGQNAPATPAAAGPGAPAAQAPPPVVVTEHDFATLDIPASTLHSQIQGFSLRNANTNIYADGRTRTLNTTILGQSVTIKATPISYTFNYGDGTTRTTTHPGAPLKDEGFETPTNTSHVYKETGQVSITLTTTYTGEYSVNAGPYQTINGTATVPSTPLNLNIYRIQHYQVQKPCDPENTAPGCTLPQTPPTPTN